MTDEMRDNDNPMGMPGETPEENAEQAAEAAKSTLDEFLHHQRQAIEAAGKAVSALFPPEFKNQSAKAWDEFKKSFQVLADRLMEMGEEAAKGADDEPPSTTGKTKVRIELN